MENPIFGFGQEDDAVHEVWRIRVGAGVLLRELQVLRRIRVV